MSSNFDYLSANAQYPPPHDRDHVGDDPVDDAAAATYPIALPPDDAGQGWVFGTHPSSSATDQDFDAAALSPIFAPTYAGFAASMPLAHAGPASSFTTESMVVSPPHFAPPYGSQSLSPPALWPLEPAGYEATRGGSSSSPARYHHLEVPMFPQTPPQTSSSQSKRASRTDDKHAVGEQPSSSSAPKKKKRKKRQSKDQGGSSSNLKTEAPPAPTPRPKPNKDATGRKAAADQKTRKGRVASSASTARPPAEDNNNKDDDDDDDNGNNNRRTAAPPSSRHRSSRRRSGNNKGTAAAGPAGITPDTREQTTEEPQTATQRERNRMAATRCRAKTKAAIHQLELDERHMSDRRDSLNTTWQSLHSEVLHYRGLLLEHQDCSCAHIRQYLRNAAHLIGETGGSHPIWGRYGDGGPWARFLEHACEPGDEDDEDDEEEGIDEDGEDEP